jgi:hypothetical protein
MGHNGCLFVVISVLGFLKRSVIEEIEKNGKDQYGPPLILNFVVFTVILKPYHFECSANKLKNDKYLSDSGIFSIASINHQT